MDKHNEKRYLSAIRRRLNMPKDLKDRVMSDFLCAIDARRENGQTMEQIMEELGDPKKAAADLNEQMKAYTYRKSPWRWFCFALSVVCALVLGKGGVRGLLAAALTGANAAVSTGIIGGADGPTAIFVTTTPELLQRTYGLTTLLLVMGVIGFIALSRIRRK